MRTIQPPFSSTSNDPTRAEAGPDGARNRLSLDYLAFKTPALTEQARQDVLGADDAQPKSSFQNMNRDGAARGKAPGLLLGTFRFWDGLRRANDSVQAWDKAAEIIKRNMGKLGPGQGFEVTLTERFGNRELSVVMMQDTEANRATLDDGNTRRLRRYWVGYTTPSQLTPSTKVEAMSPEHFIRTYDRVR